MVWPFTKKALVPRDPNAPKPPLPLLKANIFSQLTFQWVQPIMSRGYSSYLELSDLYAVPPNMVAKSKSEELAAAWAHQQTLPNPSFLRAINKIAGRGFWLVGFLRIISDAVTVTSPLMVGYITTFVGESAYASATGTPGPSVGYGFGLCVILLAMAFLSTICLHQYFHVAMRTGIQIRTALITLIYRKSLRLSAKARQDFTAGKITNLMSTDVARIDLVTSYIQQLVTAPIQLILCLALLIHYIGPSALAGFALLVLIGPLQAIAMRRLVSFRKAAVALTDARIKLTQEVLQGVRVIKFYAWEAAFRQRIEVLRKKELHHLGNLLIVRSAVMSASMVVPAFATIISLTVYNVLGNNFSAATVFTALALFSAIRVPLMMIPPVIAYSTDARVSIRRLQELLEAEELSDLPPIEPSLPEAIRVNNATYTWEILLSEEAQAEEKKKKKIESKALKSKAKADKKNKKKQILSESNEKAASTPVTLTPNESSVSVSVSAIAPESSGASAAPQDPPAVPPLIRNLDLAIERGSLVAIVGAVGSGKSSILNALVGEMRLVDGSMHFGGSIGYCPQTAWIQNATVRDNVLFGLPYDEDRYNMTIQACALIHDLEHLPDGDMTEIGERGITLSGGQKQRLNIARAVYFNADIILLDDPLSAVDAHVGKHLFDKCIFQGPLAGKTRLLVTHQWHFLPRVDRILVMHEGSVIQDGSYAELMAEGDAEGKVFARLMTEYGGKDDAKDEADVDSDSDSATTAKPAASTEPEKAEKPAEVVAKVAAGIMAKEERATGSVGLSVYKAYLIAGGGIKVLIPLLSCLVLMNVARVINDLWLSWWTSDNWGLDRSSYIGGYFGWGIAQSLFTILTGISFALVSIRASRTLHERALRSIFRSPSSFFDTTPLGRIINRFSRDIDTVDSNLSESWRMFLMTLFQVISVIILIACIFPIFLAPVAPLLVVYYYVQAYYRSSSRELKRLDSLTRSPLLAHFSESLTGLSTIRAYRVQSHFRYANESLMDANNEPYYLTTVIQRWLAVRLEVIAALLTFAATMFAVGSRNSVNPGNVGLVISYALQVTGVFTWCVRQAAEVENNMNSAERLDHYANHLEQEAPRLTALVEGNASSSPTKANLGMGPPPAADWPSAGQISFRDVQLAYRPGLPLVLKGISLDLHPGEKIGLVGRTGSGKSTIMLALFRMVELSQGSISIDGLDISTIGLEELRSHLAIIPQDPVLFAGSIRSNLDPFGNFPDDKLWSVLRRSSLHPYISGLSGGLDAEVAEGGENLSAGQRQLICLARAMLVEAKIIIMDEATASVDLQTDALLQRSIRSDFAHCTVLTIAHRLNTIIDYDRVILLSDGHVLECDAPATLLARPDGPFTSMVNETGPKNAALLTELANEAARK